MDKNEEQKAAEKPPMTEEEFLAKLDDLIAAGQAAGLRHVPFMVSKHVVRKGASLLEGLLDAVDQGYNKSKK